MAKFGSIPFALVVAFALAACGGVEPRQDHFNETPPTEQRSEMIRDPNPCTLNACLGYCPSTSSYPPPGQTCLLTSQQCVCTSTGPMLNCYYTCVWSPIPSTFGG